MLQTSKSPLISGSEASSPTEVFRTFTDLVRRQYPVILRSLAAMLLLGIVYMLVTPPSFTGQTLVMLDPLGVQISGVQAVSVDATTMSTRVDSQIPLIKSKDIATQVIKTLHLAGRSEFAKRGWLPDVFQLLAAAPASDAGQASEVSQTLVESFERMLDVQRLGLTYVIQINFRSTSPEIAAQVPNLIAETYIHEQQEAKYEAVRRASAWLQDSIKELAKQASGAEQSFIDFKTQSDLSKQSQATFHELESAAQTYRSLYENFLHRYGESVQQQSFPIADARVISRAVPPERKSHPQGRLVMAVATFGGLLIGLAIAIGRDLSDRTFRTGGQVEATLQTNFMSYIPALGFRRWWLGWALLVRPRGSGNDNPKRGKTGRMCGFGRLAGTRRPQLGVLCSASIDFPASPFAEAIRSIRLSMALWRGSDAGHVVGITSALPREGKSALAINLARLLAGSGARTLLVDCDLHKPELSGTFGGPHQGGLLATIAGTRSVEASIWKDSASGLDFLPAGVGSLQPSEALSSDAIKAVFDKVRKSYEFVIVDLSALLPFLDVRLTARFVDAYILVIEWGRTDSDVLIHALDTAKGIRDRLVGTVLNKMEINQMRRYQRADGIVDHSRLYARSGYTD
jgi:capsular exopolysaccharide synthesis family protein